MENAIIREVTVYENDLGERFDNRDNAEAREAYLLLANLLRKCTYISESETYIIDDIVDFIISRWEEVKTIVEDGLAAHRRVVEAGNPFKQRHESHDTFGSGCPDGWHDE